MLALGHRSLVACATLVALLGIVTRTAIASPEARQSYEILATLDTTAHVVTGHQVLQFTNHSTNPLSEIYLHAYLNAFRSSTTRFMRDEASVGRSKSPLGTPGELRILRVTAREYGNVDLWPGRDRHSPDDPDDTTDIRLPLPGPLESHGTLTLKFDFEAHLPELVERAGYAGSFHAVTQWFPKLARRDSSGTWLHFAYAAQAEFSADFADYRITLDVPSDYVVAAPGSAQSLPTASGRRRTTFVLANAHDFAWFAWDKFVTTTERIGDVTVEHFAGPYQVRNTQRTLDTLRWALPWLSSTYGAYPYPRLVVVHPPDDARAASAMEYPSLIVTGGPWFLGWSSTHFVEAVTLHELTHQWFYGVVASDEYQSPVLDEGLTSYLTEHFLEQRYPGGSAYAGRYLRLSAGPFRRHTSRDYSRLGPLAAPAIAFTTFEELGGRVYERFPTLLETLGNTYGKPQLLRAIQRFANRFRFAHPTPSDLVATFREEMGVEPGNTLATALFADGWVDYAVRSIDTEVNPHIGPDEALPIAGTPRYTNRILLERRGTLSFPVTLEVTLESGQVLRRALERVDTRQLLTWETTSPVVTCTLDPDHQITVDDDLTNQTLNVGRIRIPRRLLALLYSGAALLQSLVFP